MTPHEAARLSTINEVTEPIIGAAIKVHRALGPGLLESAYSACLAFEIGRAGLMFELQKPLPVCYENVRLDCGYRLDMVIADIVIVEVKAVERLIPIHTAQLLTYLKLTGYPAGLLINFNVALLKQGVRRLLNPHPAGRFLEP